MAERFISTEENQGKMAVVLVEGLKPIVKLVSQGD
jgi:hypothetical protein